MKTSSMRKPINAALPALGTCAWIMDAEQLEKIVPTKMFYFAEIIDR